MKTNGKYKGIFTALVTPLLADGCTVDVSAMAALVERQIAAGITGFLVLGGTGEYPALPEEQRVAAVRAAAAASKGRVPIIAGVLEIGFGSCIRSGRALIQAGADSLLIIAPYYVHPEQEGLYQYYKAVDQALNFPFFLYTNPGRTCVNVQPATVQRLVNELPNLIGMKECSPSIAQVQTGIRLSGDKFELFSGEEALMLASVASGAVGGMMASSNLLPEVFVEAFSLAQNNRLPEAMELLGRYSTLIDLMNRECNPGPLKYALNLSGIPVGQLALPLLPPAEPLRLAIAEEMKRLGLVACA